MREAGLSPAAVIATELQQRNPEGALMVPKQGVVRDMIDRWAIVSAIDPRTIPPVLPMPRRMQAFADWLWYGAPAGAAYRVAYEAAWLSPMVGEVSGSRLAQRREVVLRLAQLEGVAAMSLKDQQNQRRKLVLDGLEEVALDRGHNQRVKALELLGKVRGVDLFTAPDQPQTKLDALTPDQVSALLVERLRDLGLDMVDVTPGRLIEAQPQKTEE